MVAKSSKESNETPLLENTPEFFFLMVGGFIPWMEIHFAPPKKPMTCWGDFLGFHELLVLRTVDGQKPFRTTKNPWFLTNVMVSTMVSTWCELDFVHPQ